MDITWIWKVLKLLLCLGVNITRKGRMLSVVILKVNPEFDNNPMMIALIASSHC